jgi:hypothetical protein
MFLVHVLKLLLMKGFSQKCKMVYRRSVSVTSESDISGSAGSSSHGKAREVDFSPEPPPSSSSRKRHRPHDEEKEMALFRRVRIKTEIKVPTPKPRRNPSTNENNDNDLYSDPAFERMLENERVIEDELLKEAWGADAQAQRDQEMLETDGDVFDELSEEAEYELDKWNYEENELWNEAMVEQELYEMERAAELPSDSDDEKSENSEGEESEDNDEHIDMDYRFS